MKSKISIKQNYIYNTVYQILTLIVPVITTPYVSRVLQPEGIGAYSYSVSIVSYFSMIAAFGTSIYGQLQVAKLRESRQDLSILFWNLIFARITASLVSVAVYFCMKPILSTNAMLYLIMLLNIISGMFDISWFFQGLEQFKLIVLRNVIVKIICTISIFVFVRKKTDLLIYAIILQGSTLVGNVMLWPYLKQYIAKIEIRQIHFFRYWRQSFVYFVPTVATFVYTVLDKSMIGLLTESACENGYYEQAHKIEQMLLVILTSLGAVTLPRLTYLYERGEEKAISVIMKKTTGYIQFLAFPMMFGLCAISEKLVPVFLGDGYEPCVNILRIFSILLVVVGLDNTIGKQCLIATGCQKQFNKGVFVGAFVNFGLNLYLIPILGSLGAALGSVAAETAILITFLHYSRKLLDIRGLIVDGLKYCLLGVIMGIVTWLFGNILPSSMLGLFVQIFVGICTYFLLLILVKDNFFAIFYGQLKNMIKR